MMEVDYHTLNHYDIYIVANLPGFAGILPVFLAYPGSRPAYHSPIEYPGCGPD